MTNPECHISEERAPLVYSEKNMSSHEKAIWVSSLTETEGFCFTGLAFLAFFFNYNIDPQSHLVWEDKG